MIDETLSKLETLTWSAGVVGLGYVGLPLVVTMARAGVPVTGFDVKPEVAERLSAGRSHIDDVGDDDLAEVAALTTFTADVSDLAACDVLFICVPTPLAVGKQPDVSYIERAARDLAGILRPGHLVILESTTYPGTTENTLLPILQESGLRLDEDFLLGYSPERVDPGNPSFMTSNIPRVVGGASQKSTSAATLVYQRFVGKVHPVSNARTAEMAKLLENTFRWVNIALVNELASVSRAIGVDIWEVIDAAATKPFGFMPFYPGPGVGGHCLAGAETVCVRTPRGVGVVALADLFDEMCLDGFADAGDVRLVLPQGYEALSIDQTTGSPRFAPITHAFHRPSVAPLRRIRLRDNRHLTVTEGHPMLVDLDGSLVERRADELRPGDRLPVTTAWPEPETWDSRIDLIEVVRLHGGPRVRVMPRAGHWSDHDAVVRPAARAAGVEPKDVYRWNTLPLDAYLKLEAEGLCPFPRDQVLLCTGRGRSWSSVPAVIDVDEDVARLIGYYLAEGCINDDGALRVRWAFGAHEHELIGEVCDILDRLGLAYSIHKLRRWETTQIKVSNRIFATLLRDELGCGTRSEEMRVPEVLMAAPEPIRRAVLSGLLRGDGDVELSAPTHTYTKDGRTFTHRNNRASVGYFSSSPILFQQATLLLQGLGYIPSFRRTRPHLRMGGAQIESLAPLLAGRKRERLEAYAARRARAVSARTARRRGPFASIEVAEIETVPQAPVYSLEVDGTSTFVTSYGIAVHNCIPLDPFYLQWAARLTGEGTRFVELAETVNARMPQVVVGRVQDALNEHAKALRGSRVLVIGVAYKPNVRDHRESPALECIAGLLRGGAEVAYHDPHVAELHDRGLDLSSVDLTPEALRAADCVLILTDHDAVDFAAVLQYAPLILDTRNALGRRDLRAENVRSL